MAELNKVSGLFPGRMTMSALSTVSLLHTTLPSCIYFPSKVKNKTKKKQKS